VEGDIRAYAEQSFEVRHLAEQLGDLELHCSVLVTLGYSHYLMGRLAESLAFVERLREFAAGDRTLGIPSLGFSVYVWSLQYPALMKLNMGRLAEARGELAHGLEIAREAGTPENLTAVLNASTNLEIRCGAFDKAAARASESVEIAEKLGSPFHRTHSLDYFGRLQIQQKLWKDAIGSLRQAVDIAREHRTAAEIEPNLLVHLADAYRGDGQLERARDTISEALDLADQRGARFFSLEGNLVLARVLMDADGAAAEAAATEALDRARDLVEEFGAHVFAPSILLERARLARLVEDEESAKGHLRQAHLLFSEMGATGHAERLAHELEL
jgi:tetratricopeptide (TPR) repeat protein